jgi:hypothetical protein
MRTREQLQEELKLIEMLKKEREESNNLYAKIIVENIVFALVGLIAMGFVAALISLIWKQ